MTSAMVERLFWRAGFGPGRTDRTAWTGKTVGELVDWFLTTPVEVPVDSTVFATDLAVLYDNYYASLPRPPLTSATTPTTIDPLASDTELELEWIDRMQRAVNPFPERLAFFWHRHWAISRDDGIPNQWILNYRNRMLKYADFARNPTATFRQMAYDMTTLDTAMSMYLNLNQSIKGKPNENYAREFMELFCLGPSGPDGTPNYTQTDVSELARTLTGWVYNGTTTSTDYGKTSFTPSRYDIGQKKLFTANPYSMEKVLAAVVNPASAASGPAAVNFAVDAVLAHANHAQFLIRKLWAEFIASPIPQATLDTLVSAYRANGYQLKPLMRAILTHPLVFESITEPNLIKAPMVYIIGALKQFDAPLKANLIEASMNGMQQKVYFPPNVSGWEGGLSWLNTNTVQARFDLIATVQRLRYSNYYNLTAAADVNYVKDTDLPGPPSATTAAAWVDKALELLNFPWISAATKAAIVTYAATAVTGTVAQLPALRRQRLYVLQALILGGPDGQVM
jgi:uncharacterized protein (DUF1800 family)